MRIKGHVVGHGDTELLHSRVAWSNLLVSNRQKALNVVILCKIFLGD
jgi:hypothetical protein